MQDATDISPSRSIHESCPSRLRATCGLPRNERSIPMNVLVIEDHATDRKLLSVVLEMDGHVVHERSSAEGAVEAVVALQPDIVLLDLRLPELDGLALVRQ